MGAAVDRPELVVSSCNKDSIFHPETILLRIVIVIIIVVIIIIIIIIIIKQFGHEDGAP
jgi:hypothetical protein